MIIKYKNFTIEEDPYCYVLSEYWVYKKGKNIWEEYIVEQTYPATLEKAIISLIKKQRAGSKSEIELTELLTSLKESQDNFLLELKDLLTNLK